MQPLRLIACSSFFLLLNTAMLTAVPAQQPLATANAAILINGQAELDIANDEALATFSLEVQEADLARAQSQLNQRMTDGVALLKRADPKALIETSSYTTYPMYGKNQGRQIVGWRATQSVTLRTQDLNNLPKTVSAAQSQLALNGINFQLSRAARENAEAELIERALFNFNARVTAAAQALKVAPKQLKIEELNFGVQPFSPPIMAMQAERGMTKSAVAEPQFDAGLSTQQMTVTGRVRVLAP